MHAHSLMCIPEPLSNRQLAIMDKEPGPNGIGFRGPHCTFTELQENEKDKASCPGVKPGPTDWGSSTLSTKLLRGTKVKVCWTPSHWAQIRFQDGSLSSHSPVPTQCMPTIPSPAGLRLPNIVLHPVDCTPLKGHLCPSLSHQMY